MRRRLQKIIEYRNIYFQRTYVLHISSFKTEDTFLTPSPVIWISGSLTIWLKSDLYVRYRREDLITPHYWSCSVIIILTNQSFLLCDWKYAKRFVIFKFKVRYLIRRNHDVIYAKTKFIQSSKTKFIQSSLEHHQ